VRPDRRAPELERERSCAAARAREQAREQKGRAYG
jgi:hypothetical protein